MSQPLATTHRQGFILWRGFSVALLALAPFWPSSGLHAAKPAPPFPKTVRAEGVELRKLGEYRYVYRFFFDLYDVALFAEPGASPEQVVERSCAFKLKFRYLRKIDKPIILKSADRMLEKNLSPEQIDQIADRIEKINEAYRTVEDGDYSSLTYLPDVGTILSINGENVVTIEGNDFARFYFEIWLGEQPISTSLKNNLLHSDS